MTDSRPDPFTDATLSFLRKLAQDRLVNKNNEFDPALLLDWANAEVNKFFAERETKGQSETFPKDPQAPEPKRKFQVGDRIRKPAGYEFPGHIVAVFEKRDGQIRVVAEDDRGLLHIFNESQLELADE